MLLSAEKTLYLGLAGLRQWRRAFSSLCRWRMPSVKAAFDLHPQRLPGRLQQTNSSIQLSTIPDNSPMTHVPSGNPGSVSFPLNGSQRLIKVSYLSPYSAASAALHPLLVITAPVYLADLALTPASYFISQSGLPQQAPDHRLLLMTFQSTRLQLLHRPSHRL